MTIPTRPLVMPAPGLGRISLAPGAVSADPGRQPDAKPSPHPEPEDGIYDVIVIGAGPAGCAAATFTARAGLSTLVLARATDPDEVLLGSHEIDYLPAIEEPITASQAWERMRRQAERVGARFRDAEAVSTMLEGRVKEIREEKTHRCRAVILAMGCGYRVVESGGLVQTVDHAPRAELVAGQVRLDELGYVVCEPPSTTTSLAGVFACGDLADPDHQQAVVAAGSGYRAGLDAQRYLAG
ncbi:Thioredoxin reductase [Acidipropionibacterium virtanenii]|uniref:Thioredoxin reductase n=1 Tax=Acidipropionibacterium virtanenii TaxID=2057246 RepID=A0A344UPZ4_9ACTN|nr:FAD-dependent oxidoreductase [Acidipropionibacterium virtanenii]AXE37342.1 Thioredoxin reductase [Acidipropionibacterium virtanenii]